MGDSPTKKSRRKMEETNGAGDEQKKGESGGRFDFLLPCGMDETGKRLAQMFLENEELTEENREEALNILSKALMAEGGRELMNEIRAAISASRTEGVAEQAGHSSSVSPTLPPVASNNKKKKKKPVYERVPIEQLIQTTSPSTVTSDDFEPNPMAFDELRTRINCGYLAGPNDTNCETDEQISGYCRSLGCELYNFVAYPIGGASRGFWKFSSDALRLENGTKLLPPAIDLPDLQLENHLWETYVCGQLSSWIDCDSENNDLADISMKAVDEELNYATYLGLRAVVVILRRASSPRLAEKISKYLWTKASSLVFWIYVPTDSSELIRAPEDNRDIWEVWADFRSGCANYLGNRLSVGLRFSLNVDEEFQEAKYVDRWKGEFLTSYLIDTEVFTTVHGLPSLPQVHSKLLRETWIADSHRIIISSKTTDDTHRGLQHYATALREIVKNATAEAARTTAKAGAGDDGFLGAKNIPYLDVLQAPLQPLADNLDSHVYNTFEQDPIKYKKYLEAAEQAIYDLHQQLKCQLVVMVLGAGRGPIVTAVLEALGRAQKRAAAEGTTDISIRLFAVEKNPNAIVTLKYCNKKKWNQQVHIIESDMRLLPEKLQLFDLSTGSVDLIVSELLGSMGDNELSPECLDGVTPLLKSTAISIPQSYTSFIAPVHSVPMFQSILNMQTSVFHSGARTQARSESLPQEDGSWKQDMKVDQVVANMDQLYVVFMRKHCMLGEAKSVFKFSHPNFENLSNDRHAETTFIFDRACDVMGLCGYFSVNLYKDVVLSIEPATHSPGMISWFPGLLPLRSLLRVHQGSKVTFVIDRKSDSSGVWYEWYADYQDSKTGESRQTVVQNKGGESYFMRSV